MKKLSMILVVLCVFWQFVSCENPQGDESQTNAITDITLSNSVLTPDEAKAKARVGVLGIRGSSETAAYTISSGADKEKFSIDGDALKVGDVNLEENTEGYSITIKAETAGTEFEKSFTIKVSETTPGGPDANTGPKITLFTLGAAQTGLSEDLAGTISGNKITFATQKWIANIDKLTPVFAAEESAVVTVGDVTQESGVTTNDFRRDLTYTVTSGAGTRTYTVSIESPQATGLPVIKVDTKDNAPVTSKEDSVKTRIRVYDPDGAYNLNTDKSDAEFDLKDEIRGRGNTTWNYRKKPYRLKFDKKTSLFNLPAAKKWVLLANYLDPTLIMNTVTFELGRRYALPFTNSYHHVELFLNGEYQGSYLLTEQVEVGKGRVDIDENDGFLVEMDSYFDDDPKFKTNWLGLPVMIKSPAIPETEPQNNPDHNNVKFVRQAINALDNNLQYRDSSNYNETYEFIDKDNFIKYIQITEMVHNFEVQHPKSTYMYRDKNGKISMGPLWDYDWAFGYAESGHTYWLKSSDILFSKNYPPVPQDDWRGAVFFGRLFDDPAFRSDYKRMWNEKLDAIQDMEDFITGMGAKLQKSKREDYKKWGIVSDYSGEITKMKNWWKTRAAYLTTEFNRSTF